MMIKHTYDKESKAAYIKISEPNGRIGTLEVQGEITYRKPAKREPFKGMVLLDFDENQCLVGVEIVGESVPKEVRKGSVIGGAHVELSAYHGDVFSAIKEGNDVYETLKTRGMTNTIVRVMHNDIWFSCNGDDPTKIRQEGVLRHQAEQKARHN